MVRKKAHKINVFRFVGGNSGKVEPIGFIWRHGEIEQYIVPAPSGAATPTMVTHRALVVQISGVKRFVTASEALEARGMPFEVTLCGWDRDPSGLYKACVHCNGKGYKSAPKPIVDLHAAPERDDGFEGFDSDDHPRDGFRRKRGTS